MRRGLTRKQKGRGCGCGGMEMLGFPKTGGFTSLFGGEEEVEESTEGGVTRRKPIRQKTDMSIQSSPSQESSPVIPAQESSPVMPDGEVLPDATDQSGEVGSILPNREEMRKGIQQKQQQKQRQQQEKMQAQQERQRLSATRSGPITYNSDKSDKPSRTSARDMPSMDMGGPMDNSSEMNSDAPMKKSRASISRKSIKQEIPSFEQAAPFINKELKTMRREINDLKNKISGLQSSSGGPSRGLFGGRRKTLRRIRKHRG
jgi:hypothetical protein